MTLEMEATIKYLDKKRISYAITADGFIRVDGGLAIDEGAPTFSGLEEINGSVYVRQGANFNAPALEKVGSVYVRHGATFNAPMLEKVGGDVDVYEGATFNAPMLTTVSGGVYVDQGATFDAPMLTTVGSSVYVHQGATFNAPALVNIGEVRYNTEIFGQKVIVLDGIGCVVVSEKEKDGVTIRSCRKSTFKEGKLDGEAFYVASQGEHNAHGESIKEALDELLFKTGSRDVSVYKNMPLDTVKTASEWAITYRIITGACQYGTKKFMDEKGNLKESYTLAEILNETNGAYGHDKFRSVVGGNV